MSNDTPPRVKTIRFTKQIPFVQIAERYEGRGEHLLVLALTAVLAAYVILESPAPYFAGAAAFAAFFAGYAWNNWLVFDDLYDDPPEGN